ncbi:RND family efflux transporter, MFP subunit [Shewanella psychrophila]|uniref:RND family efflux transporter, MFP subunit n=1 Tax=Shewanella psychrophila TaxID=225848 RepID=A0A1S6HPA3_9GAMM|nr:efflux RND transporter periplasmic adaptor subunit [Shewanella psychrophila]AQS37332.1 RND family efflux transporter, MFP subunit [Shewanella psychrophila]
MSRLVSEEVSKNAFGKVTGKMSKAFVIATFSLIAIILLLVFGFYFFKQYMIKTKLADFSFPPVAVTSVSTHKEDWLEEIKAVGHVTANQEVNITPQLSGQIKRIAFSSGEYVEKGQLIVQLDTSLLKANLKTSLANLMLAELEYQRQLKLLKTHSTSQDAVDSSFAKLSTSQADVEYIQTQMDFMAIKAPFSGRLGIRNVNLGDYVQPGTSIVELQNQDNQFIDFSIPEAYLSKVALKQQVHFSTDTYPDEDFIASITAIDPMVDSVSHNLDIRAQVLDSRVPLISGMYVEANIQSNHMAHVIPLPSIAVTYSLYGDAVYVLKPETKFASKEHEGMFEYQVERRAVQVGRKRGGNLGILKGLKVGEQVVTSNQQQLKPGSKVLLNNSKAFAVAANSDKTSVGQAQFSPKRVSSNSAEVNHSQGE